MTFSRRGLVSRLSRTIFALAAFGALGVASAQTGKPVKLMVGFPPGGGTDAIARILAERLKDELGVPVIVENKPGAGGQIAAQALKAAPADGTTYFLSHDHTITILPMVTKNPGFAPATDFMPVAGFATFVNAFAVSGGTPAKSFNEYVTWVRTQGGGKGSVSQGQDVWEARCAACHGKDGNTPIDPSYPRLSGQHADYLVEALKASGEPVGPRT